MLWTCDAPCLPAYPSWQAVAVRCAENGGDATSGNQRIHRLATFAEAREHVTSVPLAERPDLFLVRSVDDQEDNSDPRWLVDTVADLSVIRAIYRELSLGERVASYRGMLDYAPARPEIGRSIAEV